MILKPPSHLNIDNATNIAPIKNIKNPLKTTNGINIPKKSGSPFGAKNLIEYITLRTKKNKLNPNNIVTKFCFIYFRQLFKV